MGGIISEIIRSDGFLAVNKALMRELGLNNSVLLCDLLSKKSYFKNKNQLEDGWFFNTESNREWDTGLISNQQRKCIKELIELNIIKVKRQGLPARQWFYINEEVIEKIIKEHIDKKIDFHKNKSIKSKQQVMRNEITCHDKNDNLSCEMKQHNNNKYNNINLNNNKNSFSKEKDTDLKNPSYKTSDNSSSNKSIPKRKPLQRSKSNNKTLSPKLIHTMTEKEKEKFYEYQTKAVRLSEREKIKLKIQEQQKEADLLKQKNKSLQTKNNSKNFEKIIYNKNINSNQLIEFWNNLGIIKHQKGKVIEKSIIAIDKHLKNYTEDQIKQSMKQYSIMLSGNGYSRIQDRAPYKVSLPEFFEFDDFTLKRISKSNGDKTILKNMKSWFIECLNDENYLKDKYSVIAKDKHPKITAEIKKAWNKFLYEWDGRYEEMKEEGQYTALEENTYRKISRRLVEFFEANKNELKADDALELTQWFESCVTEIENSDYQLGFLAGDIFWGSQFINYLKDAGDMSDRTYTQKEMMALSDKERKQMDDDNDEETNYLYLYEGMNEDMTIADLAY